MDKQNKKNGGAVFKKMLERNKHTFLFTREGENVQEPLCVCVRFGQPYYVHGGHHLELNMI